MDDLRAPDLPTAIEPQLGVQLYSLEVRSPDDFDKLFEDAAKARAGALLLIAHPVITQNLKWIADLAAKSRLPSIHRNRN